MSMLAAQGIVRPIEFEMLEVEEIIIITAVLLEMVLLLPESMAPPGRILIGIM